MNQKFQAAVHKRDDVTYVKLAGVIDEDNELGELTEKIPSGTSVIDLSEVERINSCGVRDWVNWLGRVEKNGARVVLVECSPAIVAQINLVNNFTGGGVVKSFFAPYFCPNCDREKVLLVEAAELGSAPHKAPTCRCDECDGVMDFDDMEDSYFAFLSNAKKVAEAEKIKKIVAEFNPDGERSKIRSRVGSSVSGGGNSLPSVPSLPSIAKGATSSSGFTPGHSSGKSSPKAFPGKPVPEIAGLKSNPAVKSRSKGPGAGLGAGKSVYIMIAIIIAAIGVLAVLLMGGSSKKPDVAPAPAASATQR